MKNLLLFCLIYCYFTSNSQGQSKKPTISFHSETALASFNMAFANKIGENIWLGLGVGGGLTFVQGNFPSSYKNDWTKEAYHFKTFLSNNPQKKFNYEIGILSGQIFYDKNQEKGFSGDRYAGPYIGLYYGWSQFKIGTQFTIGELSAAEKGLWMWTPVILRYTINFHIDKKK